MACKALKCLVLLKLERQDEAQALASELEAIALSTTRTAPPGDASNMDENALTFLSQYYKDLRQYDKVVNLYEAACKREPNSEELHCSLFMAFVRAKDYKNQVITAQKLYKLTRKYPYYNWAVISVLLQIDENSPQLKQTLYIPMALRMLEKEFFDENVQANKNYSEMECLLYLHSLELKQDFAKALAFLQKNLEMLTKAPSNESMLPAYFSHEKQLIYRYKANQLDEAYRLAKEFLREDNHLWNWYEVLFDTFFRFEPAKQQELVNDLHEFVLATPEGMTDLRSLHLARIELGLRWLLFQLKNPSTPLPSLASTYLAETFFNQITSYIDTYANKTTGLVMFDIYRSFEYLSAEDRTRLHTYLIDQMATKTDADHLQQLINLFYCARLCGESHRTWLTNNAQTWIERLSTLAQDSATPTSSSIELMLLVANMMEEIGRPKVELYALLERLYERDPTHFDVKLHLYRTALHFNSPTIMKRLFERLEIKNIQYYSLGYLLTDHYLRIHSNYHQVRNFLSYLANLLLIYTDDSWSQIMFCYKYGNFLRINEIRTFSDSYLSLSLIYFQSLIGSIIVDLIQNGHRYASIGTIFKDSPSQTLFDNHHLKANPSFQNLFYKNEQIKLQDTRDFDIWPKIDHRRLRFDPTPSVGSDHIPYADRILAESAGPVTYQSPSYKDSFLRQHQSADFQQRITLTHLRATILHSLQTLYHDASPSSSSGNAIRLPDEKVFQTLRRINEDLDRCVKSIKVAETITPCELKSIVDLELYQSIPLWIQLLVDGITLNPSSEASATPPALSLANAKVHFDQTQSLMTGIGKQLERSYQLLEEKLAQKPVPERMEIDNLSGPQSPLELYSVYIEFISYVFSLHWASRSILAKLFNKTTLLTDPNDLSAARPATTKKSKKKAAEQQAASSTSTNENEDEVKLWTAFEKVEQIFDHQWTQIITNIRKYEELLRQQDPANNQDYERFEKDLDFTSDATAAAAGARFVPSSQETETRACPQVFSLFRSKGKVEDENNNKSETLPLVGDTGDDSSSTSSVFELGKTTMRPTTVRQLAVGYLESFMQIRIALSQKQKNLQLRSTSA